MLRNRIYSSKIEFNLSGFVCGLSGIGLAVDQPLLKSRVGCILFQLVVLSSISRVPVLESD